MEKVIKKNSEDKMENSLLNKLEISKGQIFNPERMQKHPVVPPHIISQVQFLINRTDELKTVLKEIDETLMRIKEESLNIFFENNSTKRRK
jgi:hypothetical protein